MHARNRHNDRYDFSELKKSNPALVKFIIKNKYNNEATIDFSNPAAVIELNKAILKFYYHINFWEIPKNYLCPPIPGRADYLHYAADLLGETSRKETIRVLDIGCGSNCVYPLIGNSEYGWKFIGSDVDSVSVENAKKIVHENKLDGEIEIRLQTDPKNIFKNIIQLGESFELTICNPPFHSSKEEAEESAGRKNKNLKTKGLNFGGQSNELWVSGGEGAFIKTMVEESTEFKSQVKWFSSLVSSKENLSGIYGELKRNGHPKVKTYEMKQGQKISRFVAWSFTE